MSSRQNSRFYALVEPYSRLALSLNLENVLSISASIMGLVCFLDLYLFSSHSWFDSHCLDAIVNTNDKMKIKIFFMGVLNAHTKSMEVKSIFS